ncbi:MAG: Ni,Fe-hydrogenase III large subunit, partial [Pseudomonadales bacterium]|nr:Ni,Fe-hydrogenase III large subunit [Pseudomonadales bacterium]
MTHHLLDQAKIRVGPVPMRNVQVDAIHYRELVAALKLEGYRCVSLMGYWEGRCPRIELVLTYGQELLVVMLVLPMSSTEFPDISDIYPCTQRMQRATYDLCGLRAQRADAGTVDARPWLNHGWPVNHFPLHPASADTAVWQDRDYDFIKVSGAGVHEIAVGPVHAGIIEPGHFRFSVVGEKVLRLEQRLGYTHRGVAWTLARTPWPDAGKIVGRICGDSTVAFSWAWCMALEQIAGISIPPRATWLRALLLERERIANHLGDLGALANDAGWSLPQSWLSRLREDWLREHAAWCGHRLLMDTLQPGGCAQDIPATLIPVWLKTLERLEQEILWI